MAANLDGQIEAAVRRQLQQNQSGAVSAPAVAPSTWTPQNTTGGVQENTPSTAGTKQMGLPGTGLMPASGGPMTVSFASTRKSVDPQELRDGSLIPELQELGHCISG